MIDYGMYKDGVIVKQARFCAVTLRMPQLKRTHRIKATDYFFITDATIPITSDDIEIITQQILAMVDTKPVETLRDEPSETSDAQPTKSAKRSKTVKKDSE